MVSYGTLWSTSIDLWVRALLKDLRRNRTSALLGILRTFSRRRGLKAFYTALLHCCGDYNDPLVVLLLRLCQLSRYKVDIPKDDSEVSSSTKSKVTVQDGKIPTYCMLSRCILATITPFLLHVLLSRRKVPMRHQSRCHCHSAIIQDFNVFASNSSAISESYIARCRRSSTRLRSKYSIIPRSAWLNSGNAGRLERAIYYSGSTLSLLRQVDPSESATQNEIVDRIKSSDIINQNPIDNISGLQAVLVLISEMHNVRVSDAIPCSLYQVYENLQGTQGPISTCIEDAIVYLQRLKTLDLDFKSNRIQLLRDAAKEYNSFNQQFVGHTNVQVREPGIWDNVKRAFRMNPACKHQPKTGFYRRISVSDYFSNSIGQGIDDRQLSFIVGNCLLFSSEYINIYVKLYSALTHGGGSSFFTFYDRFLMLAARAMIYNGDNANYIDDDMKLSPPLIFYYTFLNVIGSISGDVFVPLTEKSLYFTDKTFVDWISNAMFVSCNKYASTESSTSSAFTKGDSTMIDTSLDSSLSELSGNKEGLSHVENPVVSVCNDLISNRRSILQGSLAPYARRVYISEEAILCILRAHTLIFKINFDHMRGSFRHIQDCFKRYMELHSLGSSTRDVSTFQSFVKDVLSGRRSLHDSKYNASYIRLALPYALYSYAQLVFTQLSKCASRYTYPQAFWLSNCHMAILSRRIRGRVSEPHL
ncbi:hypothetical protein BBOV_I002090 [Babesia bovis T2Bo]|uniref:Uncharacterized protein n=1 Tax=Babesia bovis TaxID=5865 RepID=A7AW64_BABBO|nr:hypothetical protein BBOV_I002090 [Babesia bovis T2Bo]EDO05292.1 hypothetical protein BBOV_I002090 [Babesia bovis T2Bo]|eukprot:XP_001608860.1 hypothetical protein [Babesia bovis T2Bo]